MTSRTLGIIGILLVSLSTRAAPAGAQAPSDARHQKLGSGPLASDSAAAYEFHLKLAPNDIETRTKLGVLYSREKKFAKALHEFQTVLSAKPDFPPALVGMARVLSWQGHYAQSLGLYDRVLRSDPANGDAAAGKAFVLLWSGRASEAEALFSDLNLRYPHDGELAEGLKRSRAAVASKAEAEARRVEPEPRAEGYSGESPAPVPKTIAAANALPGLAASPNRCREDIHYVRQALALSPDDISLQLSLARSLVACQQYSEAIDRYRDYLKKRPDAGDARIQLAQALLRSRRILESLEAYRRLLQLEPANADARLGLAQALSSVGLYSEAFAQYDGVLEIWPENYDALQAKAFLLYRTGDFARAKALFQRLAAQQPNDQQNAAALQNIGRAEEEARWAALRPPSGAPLADFERFYETRLASDPGDVQALKALADIQSQLGDLPAAIRNYRQLTEKDPNDVDARMELARLLGLDRQCDAAMKIYRHTSKQGVKLEALEGLADIMVDANRLADAISIYKDLAARSPAAIDYRLAAARLELIRKDDAAAREDLFLALSIDPQNHEAQAQLAQLELAEGAWDASAKHFGQLLKHDSGDLQAVMGQAQTSYYMGNLGRAQSAAQALVEAQPENFDAVFLLAGIEHARGQRRLTQALLDQAAQLVPASPEVAEMRKQLSEEPAVRVRTTVAFARETGPTSPCPNPQGCGQLDVQEDLRGYSYGSTIETQLWRGTVSDFSFASLPSESPSGRDTQGLPIPLGISGAVAPTEFLYRQTTRLSSRLSLRSGVGLVRFGPGESETIAGRPDPIRSATISLLGLGGFSYVPNKKISMDLDFSRSPVLLTPTSVRLGVTELLFGSGLNFFFTPRTELHVKYFYADYSSEPYQPVVTVGGQNVGVKEADHQGAGGGSVTFNRNLFSSTRLSFDAGFASTLERFFRPPSQMWLGFFTPGFYQSHLATTRLRGKLWGPLGYDFSGKLGVQQIEHSGALTRALEVSPAFTLKASRSLLLTLGYTHYNNAQSLGSLRGNAIRLTTDWK